jgi:epoxyqueuosine reductase QueG
MSNLYQAGVLLGVYRYAILPMESRNLIVGEIDMPPNSALKQELVEFALHEGAALFGVASPDRFEGAPRGHHPRDFVPQVRSVISVAMKIPELLWDWEDMLKGAEFIPDEVHQDVEQGYLYGEMGYGIINRYLEDLAFRLTTFLELRSHRSFYFSPVVHGGTADKIPLGRGLISHRHAAVRAGLGEFGLNNLVVTPQYGPHIRFVTILTEVELAADPLLSEKTCLGEGCSICLEGCKGAITLREGFDPHAVWYDPPSSTDILTCRSLRAVEYCMGRCLRKCPVGRLGAPEKRTA